MRLAFLSAATSIHTKRWVTALAARGHEVTLFTQHVDESASLPAQVRTVRLPWTGNAGYFTNAPHLRRALERLEPDLLNVHYASGYGTMAMLAGFSPCLLSVWGSDVFDFPHEAAWKRWLVRRNLASADAIGSTSNVMGDCARALLSVPRPVFITPFGVDCERFRPAPKRETSCVTVGTVKTLAPKYGIDILLRAFAKLLTAHRPGNGPCLRLIIVGGGGQREELGRLASQLGIGEAVQFVGAVPHDQVPEWLNRFNIFVAASRLDSESFGVAAVEAGACGIPSIVTAVGGLPEVVRDGETGLVVPKEDVTALSGALIRLVTNASLREQMGRRARDFVLDRFEWGLCVEKMERAYQSTIDACRASRQS